MGELSQVVDTVLIVGGSMKVELVLAGGTSGHYFKLVENQKVILP